jgi:hypothetical protein
VPKGVEVERQIEHVRADHRARSSGQHGLERFLTPRAAGRAVEELPQRCPEWKLEDSLPSNVAGDREEHRPR